MHQHIYAIDFDQWQHKLMKWHENLAGAYNLVISHTHALLQHCIVTSYIVMITVGDIARCW